MSQSFTEDAEYWSRKERERRGLDVDPVGALLAKSDTPWSDMGCDKPTGMSAQHTPGRLTADGTVLLFARNAGGFSISGCPDAEANARRLAACWNACEGLSTEALESLGTLDRARVSFNVQRDKLLAQLRRCREMVGHPDNIAEIDKTIAEVQR